MMPKNDVQNIRFSGRGLQNFGIILRGVEMAFFWKFRKIIEKKYNFLIDLENRFFIDNN